MNFYPRKTNKTYFNRYSKKKKQINGNKKQYIKSNVKIKRLPNRQIKEESKLRDVEMFKPAVGSRGKDF